VKNFSEEEILMFKVISKIEHSRKGKVFRLFPGEMAEILYQWENELFILTSHGHVLQINLRKKQYA
jgi:hypothetical protein